MADDLNDSAPPAPRSKLEEQATSKVISCIALSALHTESPAGGAGGRQALCLWGMLLETECSGLQLPCALTL